MAIPTILQGDTAATIRFTVADGFDYSDAVLGVIVCGHVNTYSQLEAGQTLELSFSAEKTSRFPLGTHRVLMSLCNSAGEKKTLPWGKIKVTDAPEEVYDAPIIVDPSQLDVTDAGEDDSLGDVKAKLNRIMQFLRGGVMVLVSCLSLALFGLDANTKFNDIKGSTTIGEIVAAGGCGANTNAITPSTDGQAVTNIVKGLTDAPIASKRGKYDLNIYSLNKLEYWGIQYWDVDIVFSAGVSIRGRSGAGSIEGGVVRWYGLDDSFAVTSPDGNTIEISGVYPLVTTMDALTGSNDFATWTLVPHYAQLATTTTVQSLVTNVVRDVLGTVYDEELKVTWKQVMHDGNLYYIAVTNANITEVSE